MTLLHTCREFDLPEEVFVCSEAAGGRPLLHLLKLVLGLGDLRIPARKLDRDLPTPELDSVNGELLGVVPFGNFPGCRRRRKSLRCRRRWRKI